MTLTFLGYITTIITYVSHVNLVDISAVVKTQTAPYLGRMTEAGKDGMAQVAAMQVLLCLAFGQMFLLTTDSLLSIIIYH
jgi:hypothetical protein